MRKATSRHPLLASFTLIALLAGAWPFAVASQEAEPEFWILPNVHGGQILSGWFTFRVETIPGDAVEWVKVDVDEFGDGFRHVVDLDCCQGGLWTATIHTDTLMNGQDVLRFTARHDCGEWECDDNVTLPVHVDNPNWHDLEIVRFARQPSINLDVGRAEIEAQLTYGTNDRAAPDPVALRLKIDHAESGGVWVPLETLQASLGPNEEKSLTTTWEDLSRVGAWAIRGTIEVPAGFSESRGHGLDPDVTNLDYGTAVFVTNAICCRQIPFL